MDASLKPLLESNGSSLAKLARQLGVNKSTVSRWRQVPVARLKEVSKATGIPVAELRPDIPWSAAR